MVLGRLEIHDGDPRVGLEAEHEGVGAVGPEILHPGEGADPKNIDVSREDSGRLADVLGAGPSIATPSRVSSPQTPWAPPPPASWTRSNPNFPAARWQEAWVRSDGLMNSNPSARPGKRLAALPARSSSARATRASIVRVSSSDRW